MTTLLWVFAIGSIVLIALAAPSTPRPPAGPSWFDLQPYMRQSKKQRGRLQQKQRHGTRRYGT
ncbi:hypothetical protein MN032_17785 [Agromyces atrinae]|uniref:hypothetical protein n=1 Tax=Agromyces atrinae TaxID=592376 RepID=UPI001F5AA40A|nr:hypothetical protein [Agromyces atrinae]MCI2959540.1 hypothetical protein [Agromyces atrinae]